VAVHDIIYDTLDAELHQKYVLFLQATKSFRDSSQAHFISLFTPNVPFASPAHLTLFGTL